MALGLRAPGSHDAAIEALIGTNVTELHRAAAGGGRTLDAVYNACVAGGIAAPGLHSVEDRYVAVFDAALQARLGCWVLDYVELVCGDPHLTSNDPLEAYLLDGQFVKAWAARSIVATKEEVQDTLHRDSAGLEASSASGQLLAGLSRCHALVAVLQALDRIRGGAGGDRAGVRDELQQALLLQSCLQAMSWCVRHHFQARPNTGRHASWSDWSGRVSARHNARARAAAVARAIGGLPALSDGPSASGDIWGSQQRQQQPTLLFIEAALAHLSMRGSYPFSSLTGALHALFIVPHDTSPAGMAAKLCVLLYYILDLGWLSNEADLEDFRRSFHVPSATVAQWHCQFLLDCAEPAPEGAADPSSQLGQACRLLLANVQPDTPFQFIEVLLGLGCADVALAVHRAQAAPAQVVGHSVRASAAHVARPLREASVLLELRLRCGLLTEAFTEMRRHCAMLPTTMADAGDATSGHDAMDIGGAAGAFQRSPCEVHTEALVTQLAEWALRTSCQATDRSGGGTTWMQRLLALPFNLEEEGVLVRWLVRRTEAGEPVADHLVLYFLQRGRIPEAMGAFTRWQKSQAEIPEAAQAQLAQRAIIHQLADDCFARQPKPLRNMAIEPDPAAEALRYGAVGLVAQLKSAFDTNVPLMRASFSAGGSIPPPFVTSRFPAPQPAAAVATPWPSGCTDISTSSAAVATTIAMSQAPATAKIFAGPAAPGSAVPIAFGVPIAALSGAGNLSFGLSMPLSVAAAVAAPPQTLLRDQSFNGPAQTPAAAPAASVHRLFANAAPLPLALATRGRVVATSSAATPPAAPSLFAGLGTGSTAGGPAALGFATRLTRPAEPRSVKRPRTQGWLRS